ncbi:hypothetical protein ULMS_06340 [Patiriisocius marinistellae]|uniref:Uncharacterized protein n=1 Tax=Patiriisocius marinistellae TaxID=2494560 RepID=A0A5J4FYD9_9FLAO|nr:DUF6607 family protein [Patiriisocius marinistellae]GEQ85126.1 hypothetical protein ULMS_06340 [Patiriisocius marinistellae]
MKNTAFIIFVLGFTFSTMAQSKKQKDQEAIKAMCGCYEVTFNFAETFQYSEDSLYRPSKNKVDKGLEWAQLVTDEDDKISIQHLLQVGNPAEPMVIKHWRQDWLFENTDLYTYHANNKWAFQNKAKTDVAGQWTQKVFQVDDSPRYEGSATWVHVDGKSYWENTTDAPLPRREYTTRSDYNVTERGNRQEIKNFGWIHDQNNKKIVRKDGKEDVIVAHEKGYNVYKKVDDNRCAVAAQWWKDNTNKWALVRTKWDEIYGRNKDLVLEEKVDNKVLYKYLFDDGYETKEKIDQVIESFVKK